jgi:tetratricopeptide (TPR) repeat protein
VKPGAPVPHPATLITNIDPQLDRLVMAALSVDPEDRPASVLEMASMLSLAGNRDRTGVHRSPRPQAQWKTSPLTVGLTLATIIVVLVIGSSYLVSPGAVTLNERDTIVLADFENATGEPVFDGTLKVAMAVGLEQSPFLRVFPDERARETLRLMERAPGEAITRAVAREIAQREQLKAFLVGSIARIGENYVIGLEASNAQTGDVMAREQAEAATKEQVLTSLGVAITRLRQRLGESLASVQKFDVPLPRATTASLDALHAYALALDQGRAVPRLEAIPHLKRAIELDPTFAMAYAFLSAVYANTGQSSLAPEFSKKAFDLRDRVSDRERFFIAWRYYRDSMQAWDKAIELARSWTATYPREANAFNALGVAHIRLGQFAQSIPPLQQSIDLDPQFVPPYGNLAASLLAVGKITEARATLKQAADRKLDFTGANRLSYLVAFVEGTLDNGARAGRRCGAAADQRRARLAGPCFRGRRTHQEGGRAVPQRHPDVASRQLHGGCGTLAGGKRRNACDGRTMSRRLEGRRRRAAPWERQRHARARRQGARPVRRARRGGENLERAAPVSGRDVNPAFDNCIAAGLPFARETRLVPILEPVRPYDHAPSAEFWSLYLRGLAYLGLKDGKAAAAEFQGIVDHQGEVPSAMLYPFSYLGLARANTLMNNTASARAAYERLFELWKEPDADLRPLAEARAEYGRLK